MAGVPDDTALAARIFEQHGSAIRRYLRRLSGHADVANDLTQDVYVRVVRAAAQYEPRERERAWLFRIARNVFLDHRKAGASPACRTFSSWKPTSSAESRCRHRRSGLPDRRHQ
jgi:RNA polymerase sigma factor (sigma-70 family)